MALKVNLLPKALSQSTPISRLVKIINRAVFLGVITFVVLVFAVGAFLIYASSSINASKSRIVALETEAEALSQVEAQNVLIKDRLSKLVTIMGMNTASNELADIRATFFNTTALSVNEFEISSDSIILSGATADLASLGAFLDQTVLSGRFGALNLESLDLVPASGYAIDLTMSSNNLQ